MSATAVITAVMMTAVMSAAATTAGSVTTAAATAAATLATTTTAVASQHFAIAPDEGDANHREKDRDAEQQSTIHPKSSNKQVPYLNETGPSYDVTPS
ncbi:MAG: hypothetical protein ACREHD_28230 [Pirellulales bacterium]